jgi:hypothetical protein
MGIRNAQNITVNEPEGNNPLHRLKPKSQNNIKVALKLTGARLNFIQLDQDYNIGGTL